MKKILLLILIGIMLTPHLVFAKTYYTEYGTWQEVDDLVVNTELQEGKTIKKYKFYQEEKEYTENYYPIGENPDDYPYQSMEQQVKPFSIWSNEKPETKKGRKVETKTIYPYQELKKISSLILYDVDGPDNKLWLTELEVLYQGEKIPLQFECEQCSTDFIKQVSNGITAERNSFLSKGGFLVIKLPQEYNPMDLICNIYISDSLQTKPIQFKLSDEKDITNPYIDVVRTYWMDSREETYLDSINLKDFINQPKWDSKILERFEPLEESEGIKVLEPNLYYRYQDTYYKYYRLKQNYLDGYYENVKNYLKDEKQNVNLYYQRTRDKIETYDTVSLSKPNLTLQDLVISSTIPLEQLSFHHNINWNENGTYMAYLTYQEKSIPISILLKLPTEKQENTKKETTVKKESVSVFGKISKWFTWKNILLSLLFGFGIFLIVYSLKQIVERKK